MDEKEKNKELENDPIEEYLDDSEIDEKSNKKKVRKIKTDNSIVERLDKVIITEDGRRLLTS